MLLLLLFCCANAVCAVSDDNSTIELNGNDNIISADNNQISVNDESSFLSVSQDEIKLQNSENAFLSVDSDSSSGSPIEKFTDDLNSGDKNVYLTGDIKVSTPFVIKHDVVIDGQLFLL